MNELLQLFRSNDILTSETLALKAMTSVRSVKSDMTYLSGELEKENIARIVSYKGKGYKLEVLNQKNYDDQYHDLLALQSVYTSWSIQDANRCLYIVQKLLTSPQGIKKCDICDALYLSESALSYNLNEAHSFLESYGLTVKSSASTGLSVEGSEQNIRSCMVEVASSSYHDVQLLYPVSKFEHQLFETNDQFQDMRHALLKILRESKMSVTDINSKKLAMQLCVLKYRSSHGYHPVLEDEMIKEIKDTYEYKIAKKVFSDPVVLDYFGKQDKVEVLNFARLLIVNRDIDLRFTRDLETISAKYIIENQKIFQNVKSRIEKTFFGSLFKMEVFRLYEVDFESILLQIYLKNRFDTTDKQLLITYYEGNEKYISVFSSMLSHLLIEKIEKEYKTKITGMEGKEIAILLDHIMKIIHIPHRKLNIAFSSMAGRVIANQMMQDYRHNFNEFINLSDVFEIYEMRRVNFSDWDYLILSAESTLYFTYPIQMILYEGLETIQRKNDIFRRVFISSYDTSTLTYLQSITHTYHKVATESFDELIDDIITQYCIQNTKEVRSNVESRIEYSYFSGASVIWVDPKIAKQDVFDVFEMEKLIYNHGARSIQYVIVLAMNKSFTASDLKLVCNMSQTLLTDKQMLAKFIDSPDFYWQQIFEQVIEEDFINK